MSNVCQVRNSSTEVLHDIGVRWPLFFARSRTSTWCSANHRRAHRTAPVDEYWGVDKMVSNIDGPEVAGDALAATDAKANSPRRVEFVDGIRALAALFVVAHHVYLTSYPGFPVNTGPHVLAPLIFGHFGVAIFMVVSGFSLALAPAGRSWRLGSGGYR